MLQYGVTATCAAHRQKQQKRGNVWKTRRGKNGVPHLLEVVGVKHGEGEDVGVAQHAAALEQHGLRLMQVRPVHGAAHVLPQVVDERPHAAALALLLQALRVPLHAPRGVCVCGLRCVDNAQAARTMSTVGRRNCSERGNDHIGLHLRRAARAQCMDGTQDKASHTGSAQSEHATVPQTRALQQRRRTR